jgi:diguanylate cyclase (GGDEF)-like protein
MTRGQVLLVEDEDLLRWSMGKWLSGRDLEVREAREGRAALELLGPDTGVLITDLVLPDMDGLSLAEHASRLVPDLQTIVITGQGSKESAINALRQGVFDYIEKPFRLELLLERVNRALEKVNALRELERRGTTDALTGLGNQSYLWEILARETARANRQERPLSLVLFDLDSFKEYNDRHGHLAGDEVLSRVAGCLKESCRQHTDEAFRYGGDEFVLIVPEAGLGPAGVIAARVRELVRSLGLEGISLSVGIAELAQGQDERAFFRHADEAMYLAKQLGGDRAVTFSPAS